MCVWDCSALHECCGQGYYAAAAHFRPPLRSFPCSRRRRNQRTHSCASPACLVVEEAAILAVSGSRESGAQLRQWSTPSRHRSALTLWTSDLEGAYARFDFLPGSFFVCDLLQFFSGQTVFWIVKSLSGRDPKMMCSGRSSDACLFRAAAGSW